jgi:virginiamycin B lyase
MITRRTLLGSSAAAFALLSSGTAAAAEGWRVTYFDAVPGSGSRDIVCTPDGMVWYCGQRNGTLTRLDPRDGSLREVPLGPGAAPHGVVRGPDGALWVTEGGQNAIARVDPDRFTVDLMRLPADRGRANLNTGEFDRDGIYWFTGQNGIYGRLDPKTRDLRVWDAPRGRGPYGITLTPSGEIWYVSLAGNHLAHINRQTAEVTTYDPPTPGQGARRVWSDSRGRLWISEWNSGNVSMYDPAAKRWGVWKLPGERPRTYSVYVDDTDLVWLTDFGGNAIVIFDPVTERFTSLPSDRPSANVRQMAGRKGEAWGGETGTNRLIRIDRPIA